MAMGLAALMLLAPLSFQTPAQQASDTEFVSPDSDSFMIYQDARGNVACRVATLAERRQMKDIDPTRTGLHTITHTKFGIVGDYSRSSDIQQGDNATGGLTIVLRATAQLEGFPDAKAAFIRAAATWEAMIKSPVTIYIDVDYGPTNFGTAWGDNVLGSTNSFATSTSYQTVRSRLIAGASTTAESALYNSLPASALPTDNGDQSSIVVPTSIARAIGILPATAQPTDNAAKIGFNSNYTYDFDPSDGIDRGKTDFEAVATHEIGHALGFTSRSGNSTPTSPAIWDIFRFRTGTTLSSFPTAQRVMAPNATAGALQFYFDGNQELGLSTGGPDGQAANGDSWQSSHWRHSTSTNGVAYIGIMDPAIASGVRRQVTSNDAQALNYFGYNVNTTSTPPASSLSLSQASYTVGEAAGNIAVTVNRTDSSAAATVDYATSDAAGLASCSSVTGKASSRCDYANTVGTLRFAAGESSKTVTIPVVNDGYVEGPETFTLTLSNPTGTSLGANSAATITITDNDTATSNPIATTAFFVRQQYIDFLGREPDPTGYAAWQGILNNCAAGDNTCDRISVSSGFFRSPEFQDRGYFIYKFYSAALGRTPLYSEFMPDLGKVSGFLDAQQLEANKVAFVNEFMTRTEFANRYGSLSNTAFVDTLIRTAGLQSHSSRDTWVGQLNSGGMTKATVLRAFTESTEVYNRFYNQAFVAMQYFGYLRRDPDAAYATWVQTMNTNGGDFRAMISGFINSNEYVLRFGP